MVNLGFWKGALQERMYRHDNALAVLKSSEVEQLCVEAKYEWRDRKWPPLLVLLTFLQQVLSSVKTCRGAVATTLAELAANGQTTGLPSSSPSAYCQARQRLPLDVIVGLMRQTAIASSNVMAGKRRWCGRRVRMVDGSSVSMPDTSGLQAVFPQVKRQTRGCGFPTARLVAYFDWATGMVIGLVIDALSVHEVHLSRRLWHHLEPQDVLLGDRAFSSYADIARLRERGVDSVCRMQQRRKGDCRQGTRLGNHDRLITWTRPLILPRGMTTDQLAQLPATLQVRMVRISVDVRGFRTQVIHVITTLLDPRQFPADQIAQLYRDRWVTELNLRSLKIHLGMDVLRGKSPDIVRKEIAMHVLAYNLIRLLMCEAARQHGADLHRLSFTGTLHRINAMISLWLVAERSEREQLLNRLLLGIAHDIVPHRPNRVEPRRIKRRANNYSYLTRPRAEYKARKGNIDYDAR